MSEQEKSNIQKLLENKNKVPAALLVATIGAGALSACGAEAGSTTRDGAERHPEVTSFTIKEGARIREEPAVTDPAQGSEYNVTGVLEMPVVIETSGGAIIATDQANEANGKWYKVPAKTAESAFVAQGNEAAAEAVRNDEDDEVWVNGVNVVEDKQ